MHIHMIGESTIAAFPPNTLTICTFILTIAYHVHVPCIVVIIHCVFNVQWVGQRISTDDRPTMLSYNK